MRSSTELNEKRLHAIRWGSFPARGNLLCHWEVSYYLRTQKPDLVKEKYISSEFIHDETQCHFYFRTYEQDNKQESGNGFCNYKLSLYYKCIRKMIVELDVKEPGLGSESGTGKACRIHFITAVSPSIRKRWDSRKTKDDRLDGGWERYHEIWRGRTHYEKPKNKEVFSESPVFSITFENMDDSSLYDLVTRLHHRSGAEVEFARIQIVYALLTRAPTDDFSHISYIDIHSLENIRLIYSGIGLDPMNYQCDNDGIANQLIQSAEQYRKFLNLILPYYRNPNDRIRCEWVLEQMLTAVDQMADPFCLRQLFQKMMTERRSTEEHEKRLVIHEGFVRCRKVIVMPARMIYVAPETMMGNRVLRNHGIHKKDQNQNSPDKYMILRVSFRKIRERLGKFSHLETISKVVARLGLCFTQSRAVEVNLKSDGVAARDYETEADVIGGQDSNGKEYTFSDGVGKASKAFLRLLATKCSFPKNFMPSCVQFRFRGGKGVLTLEPTLDDILSFGIALRFVQKDTGFVDKLLFHKPDAITFHKVIFRDSQMKFLGPKRKDGTSDIELVKHSTPTPLSLNRPFINILDQVSEMQSVQCHTRICNRIETLLDRHLHMVSMVLVDEALCRAKLKELTYRLDLDRMGLFEMCTEPFFRSLVKALVRYSIHKQLHKAQIQIPHNLGRAMFAVDIPQLHHLRDVIVFPRHGPRPHPDEMAGSDLDGDEYSVIWDKELLFDYNMPAMDYTSESAPKNLTKAEVTSQMISYYYDYLIQDQVGMVAIAHLAASDLYGLDSLVAKGIAKKHSQAVDFPKTGIKPANLTTDWTMTDDEPPILMPPERTKRYPDFLEKDHEPVYRSRRLAGRIYRQIRTVEDILHFSAHRDQQLSIPLDETITIPGWEIFKKDAEDDYAQYCNSIRREMEYYGILTEAELLSGAIMEMRNKLSEKEQDDMSLYNTTHVIDNKMTAVWTSFRKKFFEKANTHAGLPAFGLYRQLCALRQTVHSNENYDLHYFCMSSAMTREMKQKAVAYYKVAYEHAQNVHPEQGRVLSFPWLVWDVLTEVKREFSLNPANAEIAAQLADRHFYHQLTTHISLYCKEKQKAYEEFILRVRSFRVLYMYCLKYDGRGHWRTRHRETMAENEKDLPGLLQLLFIVSQWAEISKVCEGHFREMHVLLLFLQYSVGSLPGAQNDGNVQIQKIDLAAVSQIGVDDTVSLRGPGQLLVGFMQYVGSSAFLHLERLEFSDMQYESILEELEWKPLHAAARLSFLSMVFSSRFEDLPLENAEEALPEVVREGPPFTIELPMSIREVNIEGSLRELCGLEDIRLRRKASKQKGEPATKIRVSAMGTQRALRKLRLLLLVDPFDYSARYKFTPKISV
ncbi:unnamed protein product, partial [Mesorhabditis spiculigera]